MVCTIQSNWNEHGFLTFEQRLLVIAAVFLLVLFVSFAIKKRKPTHEDDEELEEVVGFTPFDEQDVLGLNRREAFGENRIRVERAETEEEQLRKVNLHKEIKTVLILIVVFVILSYAIKLFDWPHFF